MVTLLVGRRFQHPFLHTKLTLNQFTSVKPTVSFCVNESSDGLQVEGDHLGAVVDVADMDDLGHVEARYFTVDRCD